MIDNFEACSVIALTIVPLKLVISKGKGVKVWDTNGKQYIDCISGFSVANQGHCHPTLKLVLSSL
jgi:acetylornithine/succinyldiaminopimelate/putrescine aminotransferase